MANRYTIRGYIEPTEKVRLFINLLKNGVRPKKFGLMRKKDLSKFKDYNEDPSSFLEKLRSELEELDNPIHIAIDKKNGVLLFYRNYVEEENGELQENKKDKKVPRKTNLKRKKENKVEDFLSDFAVDDEDSSEYDDTDLEKFFN